MPVEKMSSAARLWRPVRLLALPFLTLGLNACQQLPPVRALQVAAGSTSELLCNGVFVSGLAPERLYAEEMRPAAGMGWVDWALRYHIDPASHSVHTQIGGLVSATARWREGLGCAVVHGPLPDEHWQAPASAQPWADPFPGVAVAAPAPAASPGLAAALDAAFAEDGKSPPRRTQAVVVVHRGQIVAERYAADVTADMPLAGHSLSKSLTHALLGVMVQQGRLDPDAPLRAVWPDAADPRSAISVNHLLANASGLPWDENNRGWDSATRMWFAEADPAAFAQTLPAQAAPNQQFGYSNAGWTVLSRLLRDAHGGGAGSTMDFVHQGLLAPLGMRHTVLSFDATGTPLGANLFYASARDWARLGLLYLHQGQAGGQRLLPASWVAQARQPTLGTGYGRGFWLNTSQEEHPFPGRWGLPGAPADTFFGRGYLGQFVVIVPSRQLVLVRLGISHRHRGDVAGVGRLVQQVLAALPAAD